MTPLLNHRQFRFERFGRTNHLRIDTFEDLEAVLELDEAHWVATTAPTATINCDPVFLNMMDTDQDGRLRAEEVKSAIRFLFENLTDRSGIVPGNTRLDLDMINTASETGERIHTSASKILRRTGRADAHISLEQVRAIRAEVQKGGLDEAGVVLPEAAGDERMRRFIEDIIATAGGRPHPAGTQGIDEECLDRFLAQCRQHLDWLKQAEPAEGQTVSEILPLGDATHEAYELFCALENKIAQFFLLCSIQRLDPEILNRALSPTDGSAAIDLLDLSAAESYLAGAPLALPNTEGVLDLAGSINPYYSRKLKRFSGIVLTPLTGKEVHSLDQAAWRSIRERFRPYREWIDAKPEVAVDRIDARDVRRYVENSFFTETARELIEKSHRTAFVLDNIRELERLILYQAHIIAFVNSFVSFPQLYDPDSRALFEMGTLVMDGRHFTLAVKVLNREHHVESSIASKIFVMYVEVYGQNEEKLYEVAVPVTSGNRGNIRPNKWGIFNDIDGQEWHARVVQIIENPISLREAIAHPFVRVARSFMSRLEKVSVETEEKLGLGVLKDVGKKSDAGKKQKGGDISPAGLLAGGGVALAAMGSSVAFITQTVAKLSPNIILGAVLAVILAMVVPASISAFSKLAGRDLSAILEGSGWGVNARMKLTRRQAYTFTHRPAYPAKKP